MNEVPLNSNVIYSFDDGSFWFWSPFTVIFLILVATLTAVWISRRRRSADDARQTRLEVRARATDLIARALDMPNSVDNPAWRAESFDRAYAAYLALAVVASETVLRSAQGLLTCALHSSQASDRATLDAAHADLLTETRQFLKTVRAGIGAPTLPADLL